MIILLTGWKKVQASWVMSRLASFPGSSKAGEPGDEAMLWLATLILDVLLLKEKAMSSIVSKGVLFC